MDFQFPSLLILASSILTLLLFLYAILLKPRSGDKPRVLLPPPEAERRWPLIGHLHLLRRPQPPHIILGSLAEKYGPIFTIWMGVYKTIIVSNWEIAKQCFTTNDRAFADRPKLIASDVMGYNCAMFGLSSYGDYWRQLRKITTLEFLANHRLEKLSHIRDSEVKASIREPYELWLNHNGVPVVVEMKKWFKDLTLNVMFRLVVGKRYLEATTTGTTSEGKEARGGDEALFRKASEDFFELAEVFTVPEAIPYLRWLDLGGHEGAMKKTAKVLDSLVHRWLDGHKQKSSTFSGDREEMDFMDVMISILRDGAKQEISILHDADTIIKATCLSLILAGTDPISMTLTWTLALLLNNRDSLNEAYEELDKHVGRDRQVNESNMNNLVYLQAILKETMRLYPPTPLMFPHQSVEDCTVGGHHVPKGTRLIVNLSKLHRDPNIWSDPDEFKPERFLTTHKQVDVRGQNYELLPFGSGRRMCPGVSLALQVMQLTLAALLHGFEVQTPSNEAVDMCEKVGLASVKTSPLNVLLNPRLRTHLY